MTKSAFMRTVLLMLALLLLPSIAASPGPTVLEPAPAAALSENCIEWLRIDDDTLSGTGDPEYTDLWFQIREIPECSGTVLFRLSSDELNCTIGQCGGFDAPPGFRILQGIPIFLICGNHRGCNWWCHHD